MLENISKVNEKIDNKDNCTKLDCEKVTNKDKIVNIDIEKVYPNHKQPRKEFDDENIESLCQSIKKHGILQPIVVKSDKQGNYMIIAGERRYRASIKAGKKEIPAIVKDISIKEIEEIALVENLQRENLNPIEEAIAYKNLIEEYNSTQEEVALLVGKSRPYITNTLRLLNLTTEVINYIKNGEISPGHGKALLRLSNEMKQIEFAKKIIDEGLSVRQIEALVKSFVDDKNIKKKKKNDEKDIFILDVEEKLSECLGTKVSIIKGKNKGKIEIEYYNNDDLNDIIEKFLED